MSVPCVGSARNRRRGSARIRTSPARSVLIVTSELGFVRLGLADVFHRDDGNHWLGTHAFRWMLWPEMLAASVDRAAWDPRGRGGGREAGDRTVATLRAIPRERPLLQ